MKEGRELKKLSGRLMQLFFKRVIKEATDSAVPGTGHPGLLPFPSSGHDSTAQSHLAGQPGHQALVTVTQ